MNQIMNHYHNIDYDIAYMICIHDKGARTILYVWGTIVYIGYTIIVTI